MSEQISLNWFQSIAKSVLNFNFDSIEVNEAICAYGHTGDSFVLPDLRKALIFNGFLELKHLLVQRKFLIYNAYIAKWKSLVWVQTNSSDIGDE